MKYRSLKTGRMVSQHYAKRHPQMVEPVIEKGNKTMTGQELYGMFVLGLEEVGKVPMRTWDDLPTIDKALFSTVATKLLAKPDIPTSATGSGEGVNL